MKTKILILTAVLATIFLVGCKPTERIIEVPVEVTRYVQRSDTVQVYSTDSIYIRERNDTVWIEKYKTLYRDRIQVRVDTVPKVVKVTEKITLEKKIKGRGCMVVGACCHYCTVCCNYHRTIARKEKIATFVMFS